jgi:sulfur-oxidizing protein SoxB
MNRREFMQVLAVAAAGGMALRITSGGSAIGGGQVLRLAALRQCAPAAHDRLPCAAEADLLPRAARQSGLWRALNKPPHLVGEHLLKAFNIRPGTPRRTPSPIWNSGGARRLRQGRGFAHLATLVKRMKASRPGALLLDGGDTWQGSATALWTNGRTWSTPASAGRGRDDPHWEFTSVPSA